MGRPNEFDPILLNLADNAADEGFILSDVTDAFTDEEASVRGLKFAARRLFQRGDLVRAFEYFNPPRDERKLVRRHRYWLKQYAPTDNPHLETAESTL